MKKPSLNRNQIKYLVILAMLVDHVAWAFVPTASTPGQLMHLFGRLTGATMAYFVVEGYLHTRSAGKYALRLGLFALLSWPAFCLFEFGVLPIRWLPGHLLSSSVWCFYFPGPERTLLIYPFFGVIYSLLLSLLAVWLWDSRRVPLPLRLAGAAALVWLSRYGDWQYFDPLWALCFFIFRDRPKAKWGSFCLISLFVFLAFCGGKDLLLEGLRQGAALPGLLKDFFYASRWDLFQLGVYLVPPLLWCYNGEGGSRKPVHKWFFYIFYPAHLLLLAALRFGI